MLILIHSYRCIKIWKLLLTLWQYWLWSFKSEDTKLEIFLSKNQHTYLKNIIEF
jgi:hypothetical protein